MESADISTLLTANKQRIIYGLKFNHYTVYKASESSEAFLLHNNF